MAISPLSGVEEAGDEVEQRGLAAAGGPEQRHQLAAADRQGDVLQGDGVAEALGDAIEAHGDVLPRQGHHVAGLSIFGTGGRALSGHAQR